VTSAIERVGVVVPAHNEASEMAACLESLGRAAAVVDAPVEVVVVLDACTDRTEAVCARYQVRRLQVDLRLVGAARHLGALALLSSSGDHRRLWFASTDADTQVTESWIADQLVLAEQGADAVAGVVRLSGPSCGTDLRHRFDRDYVRKTRADGSHGHVHGANLGVRGSAYLAAGGFAPVPVHEDRRLVEALRASGASVVQSTGVVVQTHHRTRGRCSGGFADTLAAL
jgi:glycosyltransferase involved in cell wall biosynthesis